MFVCVCLVFMCMQLLQRTSKLTCVWVCDCVCVEIGSLTEISTRSHRAAGVPSDLAPVFVGN